jgi:hypothetical protein
MMRNPSAQLTLLHRMMRNTYTGIMRKGLGARQRAILRAMSGDNPYLPDEPDDWGSTDLVKAIKGTIGDYREYVSYCSGMRTSLASLQRDGLVQSAGSWCLRGKPTIWNITETGRELAGTLKENPW